MLQFKTRKILNFLFKKILFKFFLKNFKIFTFFVLSDNWLDFRKKNSEQEDVFKPFCYVLKQNTKNWSNTEKGYRFRKFHQKTLKISITPKLSKNHNSKNVLEFNFTYKYLEKLNGK